VGLSLLNELQLAQDFGYPIAPYLEAGNSAPEVAGALTVLKLLANIFHLDKNLPGYRGSSPKL
jgi:hypothetical protein